MYDSRVNSNFDLADLGEHAISEYERFGYGPQVNGDELLWCMEWRALLGEGIYPGIPRHL